jgi:hypothetical protein
MDGALWVGEAGRAGVSRHWLAVHTPHIGGVLHEYRQEGGRMHASRIRDGVSNHRIGARQLDLAAWQGQQLLIPVQDRQRLLLLDGRAGWQRVRVWQVPSRVTATASLGASGEIAMLHEDGIVLSFDSRHEVSRQARPWTRPAPVGRHPRCRPRT